MEEEERILLGGGFFFSPDNRRLPKSAWLPVVQTPLHLIQVCTRPSDLAAECTINVSVSEYERRAVPVGGNNAHDITATEL